MHRLKVILLALVLILTLTLGASAESLLSNYLTSAGTTNATLVKPAPGSIFLLHATNTTTTIYYLRMYNLAVAPTCSSATGFVETIPIPPAAAAGGAGGFVRALAIGDLYTTGIGYCITGGGSSTDNTNAATGLYVTVKFQ